MKTALITGATNGIGLYTAKKIAEENFITIIHGRSQALLDKVTDEIITETGNDNVISIQADFSNLTEVKEMADEITNRYSSLDLLINNAGATFTERTEGMDGNELTLTINYLAPFLLTNSLLALLRNGGNDNAHSKIINVSTLGNSDDADVPNESDIYWKDLQTVERYSLIKAYWRSKVLLNTFTFHLANLEKDNFVNVNAVHPGTIITNMTKNIATLGLIDDINKLDNVEYGSQRILNLALSENLDKITGQFFTDKQKELNNEQPDLESREKLWQITKQLITK
tara:strand:+ start:3058 stop:3909 length:852 start_codon:yes stop_codon:yes gene_type:complete